jgi:hypothetical protein
MAKETQARELLLSLVKRGETLDPRDLTLFYAWMYSSYIALEPLPSAHRKYCKHCFDSFDEPGKRHRVALCILRSALETALQSSFEIKEHKISADYANLLTRFSQHAQKPEE